MMVLPSPGDGSGPSAVEEQQAPAPSEAAAAPPAAISLRGLAKRYGQDWALRPLDLDIGEGEFFCLLGPSGCGKTTTLNLIGGFVAPSGGQILLRGQRVDDVPAHKRDVNTVFQSYALFPHMTVRENVGFGLKMASVRKADAAGRIDEALELVGLAALGDRLPAQLSGGQQQRAAVARALVNRPAVLLLDEPLSALDLKLRKRLQVELAEIHREVRTVFVYVTHDQEEAMGLADRIAIMSEGRIEQIGTPHEIYHRPRSRFVAEFVGDSNFFDVTFADGQARLASGALVACDGVTSSMRGAGVVMVRPESITIAPSAEGDVSGLPARVVHTSFLGSCTRVAVTCPGQEEPVVAELHGHAQVAVEELTPGASVQLTWPPSAAVVVEGAPTS